MSQTDYIFNSKSKKNLLEFFRHQTTAEYGGYQLFDGTRSHLLHNPEELTELIFLLKNHEKIKQKKIQNFLEVGFNSGKLNTVLNKFFNFKHIVAIDNFSADISSTDLMANLRRKNLTLLCGNSHNEEILDIVKKFSPFDLILIDASHEYDDVKTDLKNFNKLLSKHGIMVAHDIHSNQHLGVNKAWNEFKNQKIFKTKEIVNKKYFFICGYGVVFS